MRVRSLVGISPAEVVLPTAVATRAIFDSMQAAEDLAEAVAYVDAWLNAGVVTIDALTDYAAGRPGARHIVTIRRAIEMADAAARSPWVSRLRIFYVTVAGLPTPQVNVPIFDVGGRLLGIADLLDKEAGLVTEFDGQDHRQRRQHRADNDREEWFEDAGLVVVRADSLDLTSYESRLVDRLRSGHRRGMQRDRTRDRWTLTPPQWWLEQNDHVDLSDDEKEKLFGW